MRSAAEPHTGPLPHAFSSTPRRLTTTSRYPSQTPRFIREKIQRRREPRRVTLGPMAAPRHTKEEAQEAMREVCSCGRVKGDHKLSELLFCLYEGTPLKTGGAFDRSTAREIVQSVSESFRSVEAIRPDEGPGC